MGYTTDFKGQFDCYHAESAAIGAFLQAVYDRERGAQTVFTDWLIEQGDPRGEKIAKLRLKSPKDALTFWRLFRLKPDHHAYLWKFNETRRMKRDPATAALLLDPLREDVGLPLGRDAAYFVGGTGFHGQDRDDSVLDYNEPPSGQPGLWCNWQPSEYGTALVWNGGENFYDYIEWLEYLLKHFLIPWGYVLNGKVRWQEEERADRGVITVAHNSVQVEKRIR